MRSVGNGVHRADWESDGAAVGEEYLSVDPSAVRAGQEGDDSGNIVGLTEPLERSQATGLLDLFLGLAIEEKLGGNGSGSNGVDGDLVSAKLICEDVDEAFDTCFGGDVGRALSTTRHS